MAVIFAITLFSLHIFWKLPFVIGFYGALILSYVSLKLVSAEIFRLRQKSQKIIDISGKSCDVGVAFYNENPDLLISSIQSILDQRDIIVNRVIVIDDGSITIDTMSVLRDHFANNSKITLIRNNINQGKRHALAKSFDYFSSPYAALIDSDTILEPYALSNMLKRMTDEISVVTANIRALNANENWLTKIIYARYKSAFMIERAAQSTIKSVLCASGVLSLYRTSILQSNKKEWVSQKFLNKPVQIGDDRRLTSIALRSGGSIIALDAVAFTLVPNNISQFIKQQLRWNKSFIRESILSITDFGVYRWPGLLSFLEIFFWIFFLINIAHAIFFHHFLGIGTLSITWLTFVLTSGILRNITLIYHEPRLVFAIPFYSLLHLIVLSPLRLVSLITIRDTRWGTR